MENAERLSQLAAKCPEETIAYSEVYKVLRLLDEMSK